MVFTESKGILLMPIPFVVGFELFGQTFNKLNGLGMFINGGGGGDISGKQFKGNDAGAGKKVEKVGFFKVNGMGYHIHDGFSGHVCGGSHVISGGGCYHTSFKLTTGYTH